jgi:hypothetical protein
LVSHTKGRTNVEGIQQKGAAEEIWACEKLGVRGGCRRLHTQFYHLYTSLNTIQVIKLRMRWKGHVARMENVHTMFLVGKPARKIPLGRSGHTMDYSDSGQRHVAAFLVNIAINLPVPLNAGNFFTGWGSC